MKNEIKRWVEEFVSVYNDRLEQIPCPFAKQAILKDTLLYIPSSKDTLLSDMKLLVETWDDNKEAAAIYLTDNISAEELSCITQTFNARYMEKDFVALEDHPSDPEILNGVKMNFGKSPLVLFQRLSKINKASDNLRKKGYYDNWPKENYEDVVSWRYK